MKHVDYKSFATLSTLQAYALQLPEYPSADDNHWLNPSYMEWYQSQQTAWYLPRRWLGTRYWSLALLHELLTQATAVYEKLGYTQENVVTIHAAETTRYVIVGALQGAFHSLVRTLTQLHAQGILSDDLRLQEDVYLIFNGNVIGRGAYNAQTLSVVLALLVANPERVIYISGDMEYHQGWINYALKGQLMTALSYDTAAVTAWSQQIQALLSRNPYAAFIKVSDDKVPSYIAIKQGLDAVFNIGKGAPVVSSADKHLQVHTIPYTSAECKYTAFIRGLSHHLTYQEMDGLALMAPAYGTTIWQTASSPIEAYQRLYSFFSDAFCIVEKPSSLAYWTITLWNRDVRTTDTFNSRTYDINFGLLLQPDKKAQRTATAARIAQPPLTVGCTLDLSKTSALAGKRLREGLYLAMQEHNLNGSMPYLVKGLFFNDRYTPYITKTIAQRFLEQHMTNLILSPLGTPTTETYLPLIEQKKVLVLFPYTGADIFRKPELTNIAHIRASYQQEARALVTHAVNLGRKQFAFFYQNDAYGLSPLQGAREQLKELNIEDALEVSYQRNNPNIEEAANKIIDYSPEVILFFSTHAPSASLVRQLEVWRLTDTMLMGISFLTDTFRNFLHDKGLAFTIARILPNVERDDAPIVEEYRAYMEQYNPGCLLTMDSFEGYVNARFFLEICEKIGQPITHERIVQYIEQLHEYDFKGLHFNFNPQERALMHNVWLDTGDSTWLKII